MDDHQVTIVTTPRGVAQIVVRHREPRARLALLCRLWPAIRRLDRESRPITRPRQKQ